MPSAPFASLVKSYLDERFEESPTWASTLGLTAYDERSDDLSAEAFERRDALVIEWTRRFRAVTDAELDPGERIDRDVVLSSLRGRELLLPRVQWRRQPATYLEPSLQGVFTLFLHRLRPERELADAARMRLEGAAAHVAAGRRNLDLVRTPRVYVDRAIGQAKAAVRYARELVPAEIKEPALRARLADAGAKAAAAYEEFAAFLDANKENARGDYAVGADLYTALLKEKELLPYDARALRERG